MVLWIPRTTHQFRVVMQRALQVFAMGVYWVGIHSFSIAVSSIAVTLGFQASLHILRAPVLISFAYIYSPFKGLGYVPFDVYG